MMKRKKIIVGSIGILLLAVGGYFVFADTEKRNFEFEVVSPEKRALSINIIANGVVEPEDLINVGAQVTGRVLSFGVGVDGKEVDYGSTVVLGQTLALIDSAVYVAELMRAEAFVNQAEAQILIAETNVSNAEQQYIQSISQVSQCQHKENQADAQISKMGAEMESNVSKESLAISEFERAKTLYQTKVTSKSAFDTAKSSKETSIAAVKQTRASLTELKAMSAEARENTKTAESKLKQAQIQVKQNQAQLKFSKANLESAKADLLKARQNMDYCTISSPVDGIVIDRRVNIGQTVVSNMSASSLFLIAKDLKKMQVWVSVNEADIGKIKSEMPVSFTVDAFPDSVFVGSVGKIRLNAALSQNVVTYTVEVQTDNYDLTLLPYLTATVRFTTQKMENALTVPSSALNYMPELAHIDPQYESWLAQDRYADQGIVWKLINDMPIPEAVKIVMSDGIHTAIEGEVKPDDELIVGTMQLQEAESTGTRNPFLPAPRQTKKKKSVKNTSSNPPPPPR